MKTAEQLVHPFPPTWDEHSEILILGSFPSVKSREMAFSTVIRRTASGPLSPVCIRMSSRRAWKNAAPFCFGIISPSGT